MPQILTKRINWHIVILTNYLSTGRLTRKTLSVSMSGTMFLQTRKPDIFLSCTFRARVARVSSSCRRTLNRQSKRAKTAITEGKSRGWGRGWRKRIAQGRRNRKMAEREPVKSRDWRVVVFDFGTGSGRVVTKTSGSGTGRVVLNAEFHISVQDLNKLLLRSCDVVSRAWALIVKESWSDNHRSISLRYFNKWKKNCVLQLDLLFCWLYFSSYALPYCC